MVSNEDFGRIISLVSIAGKIEGKTKFQKMVYILKCKGAGFSEQFKYHYYGPYSLDLQLDIADLVGSRELNYENNNDTHTYYRNPQSEQEEALAGYRGMIELLNKTNYRILELVGTIFFLREEEGVTDKTIIEKKLKFLKPHLEHHIAEAFELEAQINSMAA